MSIKQVGLRVAAVVLTASLAACGQGQPQSGAAASSSGATSSQPTAPAAHVAGAMLMVQPASVDGCNSKQPIVATVSWRSREPSVKVMVQGPGQEAPQLFSESGYAGTAKTGAWVVANTKFTLIDSKTGTTLAQRTITGSSCE